MVSAGKFGYDATVFFVNIDLRSNRITQDGVIHRLQSMQPSRRNYFRGKNAYHFKLPIEFGPCQFGAAFMPLMTCRSSDEYLPDGASLGCRSYALMALAFIPNPALHCLELEDFCIIRRDSSRFFYIG